MQVLWIPDPRLREDKLRGNPVNGLREYLSLCIEQLRFSLFEHGHDIFGRDVSLDIMNAREDVATALPQ